MFNLTNPTMQAISGAGGNLGAGLGESLVHIAQQKALQRSLQGVTPETNPYEIIQRFAQNRVPSQLTEQFFSPVVQQRAAQQQAAQIINQALNAKDATPRSIASAYARASSLTGSTEGQKQALDLAMGSLYGGGGTGTGNTPSGNGASPGGKQVQTDQYQPQPALGNNGMTGVPQMGQTGLGTTQQAGLGGAERFENIPTNVRAQPPSAQDKAQIRAENRQRWGLTRGDEEANRIINEKQQDYENQLKELQLQQGENTEARARQDDIKSAVEQGFQRDFAGNEFANTNLSDFAKDYALTNAKGTPEQRWNQTRQVMDKIITGRETLAKKIPSSDLLQSLDNPQKKARLEKLNVDTKAFLKNFPEGYKTIGYDMMRTDLRQKLGVGPVSAEYAINYPNPATIKRVNSLGEMRESFRKNRRGSESDIKARESKTQELAKILEDTLPSGESPLIIKDLVVNGLNYSDDIFDNALNQAEKTMADKGQSIPEYNRTARNDSKLKFRTANPLDIFGGQSLLGPTEVYR